MKKLTPLLLLATGCTITKYSPDTGFERKSLLQRTDISEVRVSRDGTVTMKGYKNDGGNEAIAAAVRAAVEGAIAGANPAP